MAVGWSVIQRTSELVTLAGDRATLLLESPRPATSDPELLEVIARLAPHLTFGPASARGDTVERIATTAEERVVVGRLTRGTWSVAYVVACREPLNVDDVVAEHLVAPGSPFAHFVD